MNGRTYERSGGRLSKWCAPPMSKRARDVDIPGSSAFSRGRERFRSYSCPVEKRSARAVILSIVRMEFSALASDILSLREACHWHYLRATDEHVNQIAQLPGSQVLKVVPFMLLALRPYAGEIVGR
jgi:hypothetical protein